MENIRDDLRLTSSDLRWCCDAEWLPFDTTGDVEPAAGVVGQDDAMDALRFGLEFTAPGQNIFVRGLVGTGRSTLIHQLLKELRPSVKELKDYCYVHNFDAPERPKLIALACGEGRVFRDEIENLRKFIVEELGQLLAADAVRAQRAALDESVQREIRELGRPLEDELRANGLALIPVNVGQTVQPTIMPVIEGQPVTMDQVEEMRGHGTISAAEVEDIYQRISKFGKRFLDLGSQIGAIQEKHIQSLTDLYESEARRLLEHRVEAIKSKITEQPALEFLERIINDLVSNRLTLLARNPEFSRFYRVNLVHSSDDQDGPPVVSEHSPTLQNLLGSVEREIMAGGMARSDHLMIQAGSLLRADGGYLIMEARDVLAEPGAWKVLIRTLRTGQLEIVPYEGIPFWTGPAMKPEPIPLRVKVILIGGPEVYHALDRFDQDFPHLFKILSDFDSTIPRDEDGVRYYAGILARIAKAEDLPPFSRDAAISLTQHGARIAGRRDRLTARFGRLADIAREAAYLAGKDSKQVVSGENVADAIQRGRRRADLPARRFRELVSEGTIRVEVTGFRVGQINGLAVIQAGQLTYGFPSRITATIGPGTAGAVNIEREAELSGAIHTKGFYILGGLLRHLLRTEHPLAFSASIAFEQSYGGIDGDSASGAEICCLLSALTDVPIRQDLAMTGAIDQHGNIQAVGAVTEKVEGFFATCKSIGLNGEQGVIVPRSTVGDLMIDEEIVTTCEEGRFHIFSVSTIHEALNILTGKTVGEANEEGNYPEGSLLHLAETRARKYWEMAVRQNPNH